MTPRPFHYEAPVVPIHDEERERMRALIRAQQARQLKSARKPVPHVRWPFILALTMAIAIASQAAVWMILR